MADESPRTGVLVLRRGLLLAGLATAAWSVTRVALLLGGVDVVADDDPHGYVAIFSLVLLPVLAIAVGTLVTDAVDLWRRGRSSHRPASGVALALSAPLAGPLAVVAVVIGVAIVVAARTGRR